MSNKYNGKTTAQEVASDFDGEIKDRNFLITGATWGGIGAEAARVLALHKAALVVVAGRNLDKLNDTVSKVKEQTPDANVRPLVLDLASLKSVRTAAAEVNAYDEHIDVLINNAGVMAPPYTKTEDGFELQFGSNHIGHFVFTNLILGKLLKGTNPRVVNVASIGHAVAPILFDDIDFSNGATYEKFIAYGQSKTANILFTRELNKRYSSKGLISFSLHPGNVGTNLGRHMDLAEVMANPVKDYWGNVAFDAETLASLPLKNVAEGASTSLVAALDPAKAADAGSYLADCQVSEDLCAPHAKDMDAAAKLWDLSEKLTQQKF